MGRRVSHLILFLCLLATPVFFAVDVLPEALFWPILLGALGTFLAFSSGPWDGAGRTGAGILGALLLLGALAWGGVLARAPLLSILLVPESWGSSQFLPELWYGPILLYVGVSVVVGFVSRNPMAFTVEGDVDGWNPFHFPVFPLRHALAAMLLGSVVILFAGTNIVQRILILAPIFEEIFKFGLALLLATLLGIRHLHARFALGILSGFTFGVFEHAVTYSSEGDAYYLSRVLFHATAGGLSMVTYSTLEKIGYGIGASRWLAPLPAILIHAINNVIAFGYAVAEALVLQGGTWLAPPIGIFFSLVMLGLAIGLALKPVAATPLERLWHIVE